MDMMRRIDEYIDEFLKEEEKCLKPMDDDWFFYNEIGDFETSNPDIKMLDFGNEWDDTYRGLLHVPDEGIFVLFHNSGETNKWCKISQERAIKYMIMSNHDLIDEFGLAMETFKLTEKDEVLNEMYTADPHEYSII